MTEPVAEDHAARLASSLTKLAAYLEQQPDRFRGTALDPHGSSQQGLLT
jgi:hypothetical protein